MSRFVADPARLRLLRAERFVPWPLPHLPLAGVKVRDVSDPKTWGNPVRMPRNGAETPLPAIAEAQEPSSYQESPGSPRKAKRASFRKSPIDGPREAQ